MVVVYWNLMLEVLELMVVYVKRNVFVSVVEMVIIYWCLRWVFIKKLVVRGLIMLMVDMI